MLVTPESYMGNTVQPDRNIEQAAWKLKFQTELSKIAHLASRPKLACYIFFFY